MSVSTIATQFRVCSLITSRSIIYSLGAKNMINATTRRRKSKGGAERADVRGDFVEGALGTGDDFVGAKAFEDFGEFVEIAADDDASFLVALAGALGDEESSLDIVGGDNDEIAVVNAGIDERAFLLGVIHYDGLASANQVVDRRRIFVDQHVGASALPEVSDEARAQMAMADDNHVIFHFTSKHAASFLRIVALQRLKNENGNDDSEQNALAPERIENPQRPRLHAKVNGGQKGIDQRKLLEIVEGDSSESEPEREQRKTPAALTEKDREPYPKEAAHGYLPLLHGEHSTRSRASFSFWRKIQKLGNGRPVGTRTPDLADRVGPL